MVTFDEDISPELQPPPPPLRRHANGELAGRGRHAVHGRRVHRNQALVHLDERPASPRHGHGRRQQRRVGRLQLGRAQRWLERRRSQHRHVGQVQRGGVQSDAARQETGEVIHVSGKKISITLSEEYLVNSLFKVRLYSACCVLFFVANMRVERDMRRIT